MRLEAIGNTPLLRIRDADLPQRVDIYAKLEFLNPGGSVKDRPARRMIEDGIASGQLTPDKIILDSTSGNTGIAYAMIGAALGYRVRLAMPSIVTQERKAILAAYGAEVVLTDPGEGSDGAILVARQMYEENADLYMVRATCAVRLNRENEAASDLERLTGFDRETHSFGETVPLAPEMLQPYSVFATLLIFRFNEPESAVILLDQMVKANPDNFQAYV